MKNIKNAVLGLAITATASPALADNWDWIYGMNKAKAAYQLTKQGFEYDGEDDGVYFWWHRKSFCVKFRVADGLVADADEVPIAECEGARES